MNIKEIRNIAHSAKAQDIYKNLWRFGKDITESHNIELVYSDTMNSLSGFYCCFDGMTEIRINKNLSPENKKIVLAHELGHFFLHSDLQYSLFTQIGVFDKKSICELEANFFCSELLIPDEEIIDFLNQDMSYYEMAMLFDVDYKIVLYKLKSMQKAGILNDNVYLEIDSSCLKDI